MPRAKRTLNRGLLRAWLRDHAFGHTTIDQVGVEVELTPITGPAPASPCGTEALGLDDVWRQVADPATAMGSPVSYSREPGGQWEYGLAPDVDPARLARSTRGHAQRLHRAACRSGSSLAAVGYHPWHVADSGPLRTATPRYRAMQRHFDRIGPWGRRMMRLTGAVQVTVDPGSEPADRAERWELAHRLSPLLVAAFAHSRVEQGRASAHASLRGAAWLHADPTRCGIPRRFLDDPQADPVEVYLDFALAAQVIGITWESSPAFEAMAGHPFGEWLDHGGPVGHPDLADWELHLSTLFPEVRPRTYLEVRSCDAPGRAWVGVPVLVIATALRDPRVRRPMLERLRPDHEELESLRQVAVEQGMAHAALAEAIDDLFARVRARWSGPAERDLAAYHERYIAARQSPGDELAGQIPGGGSLAIDMLLDLEDERRRWAARRGPRRWRMPVRTASSRVRTPESA